MTTPSMAEDKERVQLYLYSPSGPSWPVIRWPLPLPVSCTQVFLFSKDIFELACLQATCFLDKGRETPELWLKWWTSRRTELLRHAELWTHILTTLVLYQISDFRREVAETCPLLSYYAACSGNCLPTFRDILSVPSSVFKNPIESLQLQYGVYIGKSVGGEKSQPYCWHHTM